MQALQNAGNGCSGSLEKSWCSAHPPKLEVTAGWAQGHTSSPQLTLHCSPKPLLPPPPAFPEHCCPGTAPRGCAALQAPWQTPLSQALWCAHKCTHCPCLLLADFPAPNPSESPFSRLLLGLSITSSTKETFHEPHKHPQNPSPGTPAPCPKQQHLSAVKLGTGAWLCPKGHLLSAGRKSNAQHTEPQEPAPTGNQASRTFLNTPHEHTGLSQLLHSLPTETSRTGLHGCNTGAHSARGSSETLLSKHTRIKHQLQSLMSHSQRTGDNLSVPDSALPAAPLSENCCGVTQKDAGRPKLPFTMSLLSKGALLQDTERINTL